MGVVIPAHAPAGERRWVLVEVPNDLNGLEIRPQNSGRPAGGDHPVRFGPDFAIAHDIHRGFTRPRSSNTTPRSVLGK